MMIYLIIFFFGIIGAKEAREDIKDVCKKCSCLNLDNARTLSLNCTNQNLTYMLNVWPETSASKITAFFFDNDITALDFIPPTNAVLEIVLSRCKIRILFPQLFINAIHTKLVDLSYNRLTYASLTHNVFGAGYYNNTLIPLEIEYISLAYNNIHSLKKNLFFALPKLKHLNLEGNSFNVLDYQTQLAISSTKSLLELNLANNTLLDLDAGAMKKSSKLIKINLATNLFDYVPSSLEKVGRTLEALIIDNNPIFELDLHSFKKLTNLIEISANNLTRMKYVNISTFSHLKKLKTLHLSNNSHLRIIADSAFGENSNVQEIYLNYNNLTYLSGNLLQWSKLVIFEMKGNPFQCSCNLYNISQALPSDITRNADEDPYCIYSPTQRHLRIYSLTSDLCEVNNLNKRFKLSRIYRHISPAMLGLIITLVAALLVSMFLGYSRYHNFLRSRRFTYATQVSYNPLGSS